MLNLRASFIYGSLTYPRISPGWQFKTEQIFSKVLKRIMVALPVFKSLNLHFKCNT
ncbi:hypothetical protein NRIC_11170 [Enterococcus florum]|uniref:Uncharacterized protein n=1 Tax=Enterococcus florum TaxID=2480627 RepID=A0A4P5P717_9ENTE|nr:hypothetical protein NRIC_11170 [Enterococcus florum]